MGPALCLLPCLPEAASLLLVKVKGDEELSTLKDGIGAGLRPACEELLLACVLDLLPIP